MNSLALILDKIINADNDINAKLTEESLIIQTGTKNKISIITLPYCHFNSFEKFDNLQKHNNIYRGIFSYSGTIYYFIKPEIIDDIIEHKAQKI